MGLSAYLRTNFKCGAGEVHGVGLQQYVCIFSLV